MANATTVVLVAGAGLLAIGGIAYAADHSDKAPPLPAPSERCTTAADVGTATSGMLADNTLPASQYRQAAKVLREWDSYCDDQARQAGQASAALLDARAAQLEGVGPSPLPGGGGQPPSPLPFPIPGMVGSQHGTGLHGEQGTLYWYANGDEWFVPDNPLLVPYFVPGGSNELPHATTGACCGSCARGDECETGCEG